MEARRTAASSGRLQRLADELVEEGLGVLLVEEADDLLVELDYAMRPAVHERRIPTFGAFVDPVVPAAEWEAATHLAVSTRTTVDFGDAQIRRFADGQASWAVRRGAGLDELVVFDRPAGSERDLVILADTAGGRIVQRDAEGVVRIVGDFGVVRWDTGTWSREPRLDTWVDGVPGCLHHGQRTVLGELLEFAVHDLGARRLGSLLVMHPRGSLSGNAEHRLPTPPALEIPEPADLAPLRHALAQTDGAAVFDAAGRLLGLGIRLVPSPDAEARIDPLRGTRHTSALRYSHDDPEAVIVVVSDDGPVTVMRAGEVIARSTSSGES